MEDYLETGPAIINVDSYSSASGLSNTESGESSVSINSSVVMSSSVSSVMSRSATPSRSVSSPTSTVPASTYKFLTGPTPAWLVELPKESNIEGLPIFALYALALTRLQQGTVEQLMSDALSMQKQQEYTRRNIISRTQAAEAIARSTAYSTSSDTTDEQILSAKAGTAGSGSPVDLSGQASKCAKTAAKVIGIIAVVVIVATGCIVGPLSALIGAAIMAAVISMASAIANTFSTQAARDAAVIIDLLNPINAVVEVVVDTVCDIAGLDKNSEKVKKVKQWARFAAQIITTVILGIVLIVASAVATGGVATALAISGIVLSIVSLATSIVTAVQSIKSANIEKNMAKKRYDLNKIQAYLEKLRSDLKAIEPEWDMIIDLFSTSMTTVRKEYEKLMKMLKEYNDTKLQIARNFKA